MSRQEFEDVAEMLYHPDCKTLEEYREKMRKSRLEPLPVPPPDFKWPIQVELEKRLKKDSPVIIQKKVKLRV